jgi:hypothetical protein
MSRYRFRTALLAIAAVFLAMFASATAASAATSTTTAATTFDGVTMAAKSNSGVTPNIQGPVSCSGKDEWFHLEKTTGTDCYGYIGVAYPPYNESFWCWGNNYGSVTAIPLSNGLYDVTRIEIDGWSGHLTC